MHTMFKVLSFSFVSACASDNDHLQLLQARAGIQRVEEDLLTPEDFCKEKLELNTPIVNDLDGQGIMRYPSVTDGVDLVVQVGDGYKVHKSKFNGLYKGFGSINMMSGASAEFVFKFVKTGTDDPVVMPQASITWYDLDEGREGRSRGSLETCSAAGSFLPSTTELSQVKGGDGCYKTTTCAFGRKGNGPQSPANIDADHFKRTVTYSYASKSEFTVRIASDAGFNGRNYRFSLDPLNACRMTTTSTTTTTAPQAICAMPAGGYTICNMRQDPYADRVFGGAAGWVRPIGIYRVARSTDGSIEVQSFHCPLLKSPGSIAIICGLAVKMGDTLVTYTPTNVNRLMKPHLTLNGERKDITLSTKTEDASILPAPLGQNPILLPYSAETDVVCVSDNKRTATISIGERSGNDPGIGGANFFEIDWKMFMNDAVIDKGAVPNLCGQGVNINMETTRIDYHDLEKNLFSARETDFLCNNFMGAPKCNNWQEQLPHDVESNQDLCEETGTDYDKAFAACRGFANPKVEAACIFEYCQDGGEGNPRQAAEEGENNVEEGDLAIANLHDRDFVPDECCEDDPECDKNIKLAQ